MGIDVQYGNLSVDEAERRARAAWGGSLHEHIPGSTEPYISKLAADLVIATGAQSVLETGGYLGDTTVMLAEALWLLGGGSFHICEIDQTRRQGLQDRLGALRKDEYPTLGWDLHGDVFAFLRSTRETFDFVWLDDYHEEGHVRREMELLYPKMRPGGIIAMHDVCGVCPGNKYPLGRICNEFGGYVLNIGRFGPAGGIGLVQVP